MINKYNNEIVELNDSNLAVWKKVALAILAGFFSLFFSQFGLAVYFDAIRVDVPWSLIVPMMISIAFGIRYGLIAGISGGALHPFFLWSSNGYPNFLTFSLLMILYGMLGLLANIKDRTTDKMVLRKIIILLVIYIAILASSYYFLFEVLLQMNPPFWAKDATRFIDKNLIINFIIKDAINFTLLTFSAEILLCLPSVRRIFGLEVTSAMKLNDRIFLSSVLSSLSVWLFYAGIDYAVLSRSKLGNDYHIQLTFMVLIWSGILVSRVLIRYVERRFIVEQTLKESERKFRTFFEGTPDAILIADVETGKILAANQSASELLLKPVDEIIGMHQAQLHPPKLNEFSKKTFNQQASNVKSMSRFQPIENVVVRKDGNEIPVEIVASPIIYDGKNAILGVFRNISERKLIEENLQIKDFALKSSISAICLTDMGGMIIFVNKAFLNLWQFNDEKQVIGRFLNEFGISIEHYNEIITTLHSKEQFFGEGISKKKSGEKFNIQIASNIVYASSGKPICIMFSFLDITNRKKFEEELIHAKEKAEEADFLKTSFLANMSHEIRTPMNAILGFSQLLEEEDIEEEEKREYLHYIHKRGHDLLNIINDILDISKIESNELKIFKTFGDVNLMLDECLKFFNAENAYELKKPIDIFIGKKLPPNTSVELDFARIKQIINNLVSNSIKFTEQGFIDFGCYEVNSHLIFYVKDSGIGIQDEKKHLVFERFRQLEENTITKKFGGTGLGLSICKGLVELMNGEIWFESEFNKGTTFYFSIPTAINLKAIKELNENVLAEYDFKDKMVLIVEDDEMNALLLKNFLKTLGCEYILANNGLSAVKYFESREKIDLVLLDLRLPDISGYEVARRLISINPKCKIIVQSANAYPEDRIKALESGCVDFLAKPIQLNQMLEIMKQYVL